MSLFLPSSSPWSLAIYFSSCSIFSDRLLHRDSTMNFSSLTSLISLFSWVLLAFNSDILLLLMPIVSSSRAISLSWCFPYSEESIRLSLRLSIVPWFSLCELYRFSISPFNYTTFYSFLLNSFSTCSLTNVVSMSLFSNSLFWSFKSSTLPYSFSLSCFNSSFSQLSSSMRVSLSEMSSLCCFWLDWDLDSSSLRELASFLISESLCSNSEVRSWI